MLAASLPGLLLACVSRDDADRPSPAPGPTASAGTDIAVEPPVDLAVEIEARVGIHDLVAVVAETGPLDGLTWSWTRDGEETGLVGPRVSARELAPGQRWIARAVLGERVGSAEVVVPEPLGGNVIVVLLDDVGVEKLRTYEPAALATTPTIDALAERGVVFRAAWASPTCTPTRAEVLTGRRASRHGSGGVLEPFTLWELPLAAVTLPEALALSPSAWTTIAAGKWHLSSYASTSGTLHAQAQGFDWYAGSIAYLVGGGDGGVELDGYFRWKKTQSDGGVSASDVYNTTDIADDAIAELGSGREPFLLWLAFNASHTPLHVPPAELRTLDVTDASPTQERHAAMLEALDHELGRVLAALEPAVLADTTVFVLGDNGTAAVAIDPGRDAQRVKGTVYEGGVHVPLIVAGPHVPASGSCDAMVHAVDLFTTIAELAGVPLTTVGDRDALALADGEDRVLDGRSLLPWLVDPTLPGPPFGYAEDLVPTGPPPWDVQRAVRDATHKLVRDRLGVDRLYAAPPGAFDEGPELLTDGVSPEEEAILAALAAELDARIADLVYEGF